MSSPIDALSGRVAQIRRLVGAPQAPGPFKAALDRSVAESLPNASSIATVATTPASPGRSVPVGILGTDIRLVAGATVGAVGQANAAWADAGWAARLPDQGRQWADEIDRAAGRAGIDPQLLAAVVWNESSFRADAVSRSGALGLAQLMPGTAAGLGVDPSNPAENLAGGARYLRQMLDEFGSLDLALAAYNAGPGRVRRTGRSISSITEAQGYVPRVLDFYRRLGGAA